MCTRVARTFVRVGTFELVGRRARRGEPLAMRDLEALTRYTLRRDFAELQAGDLPPGDAAMARSWLAIFKIYIISYHIIACLILSYLS